MSATFWSMPPRDWARRSTSKTSVSIHETVVVCPLHSRASRNPLATSDHRSGPDHHFRLRPPPAPRQNFRCIRCLCSPSVSLEARLAEHLGGRARILDRIAFFLSLLARNRTRATFGSTFAQSFAGSDRVRFIHSPAMTLRASFNVALLFGHSHDRVLLTRQVCVRRRFRTQAIAPAEPEN